jgi:hypothetical protein
VLKALLTARRYLCRAPTRLGVVLSTTWEIHEYVCKEFNVDVDRLVGK